MKDTLIFFSERYPVEFIGGIYEEKEIVELSPYFNKIIVTNAISSNKINKKFFIPKNLKIISFISNNSILNKIFSCRLIFTSIFINELIFINKQLKLKINTQIIKVMLIELNKAISLKKKIENIILTENINLSNSLIYSFWNDYRAIAVALIKKKHPEAKTISRAHGGDIYYERHPNNYLPFKKFIFDELDVIFPISIAIKNYSIKKLNHKKNNVVPIKLGVSNYFSLKNPRFSKSLHIVSCSHIIKIKRVDLIAKGLNQINKFPFIWSHIGSDYLNNSVKNFCEKNFNSLNKKSLLLGFMDNNSVMNYYYSHHIDLFINTSSSEGIPVSIMEAMSFGIPVIATNVGGTSEIVKNGVNGFLLSPNPTPNEIAEVITKFYFLSKNEKINLRNNAFNTWNNDFNAEKNYKLFVKRILSL